MTRSKLEIIRGNVALDISDETNFVHEAHDGFGMPPMHRLTERGPLQHGVTDRGYRLDPRTVQIVVGLMASTWDEQYSLRQQLIQQLSPANDTLLKLRFTLPDGATIYQLDCYAQDGPAFASGDMLGPYARAGFRLFVPDPAWYDPERQVVSVRGTGGTAFTFPLAVPWTFGGSGIDQTLALDYAGTWIEYPEIVINGPITDAIIEHLDTGDKLDFSGDSIDAAHYYTIDCRYGYKTVEDDTGVNKLDKLTTASDLATFHLRQGVNNIRVTGSGTTGDTSVLIRYYHRYIGV